MQIIFDLHAVQMRSEPLGPGDDCLLLIRALAHHDGQEVRVVLNGALPDDVITARCLLGDSLDRERILAVQGPAEGGEIGPAERWGYRATSLLREHLIANLSPDWICLPYHPGQAGQYLPGIRPGTQARRTAVLVLGGIGNAAADHRLRELLEAVGLVVTLDSSSRNELLDCCSLEEARVVTLATRKRVLTTQDEKEDENSMPACGAPEICAGDLLATLEEHAPVSSTGAIAVENRLDARPRLAFVSPLPPDRSGIADYSAELIPELARYYEIELVHAGEVNVFASSANFPTRSIAAFEARAERDDYDRILYQMGNHPIHGYMFGLIRRYPGTVVLHDFYLGHVMGVDPGQFAHAIYESHGYPGLVNLDQAGGGTAKWEYPANYEVLRHAGGIVVHSGYARRLAEHWYGSRLPGAWDTIPLLRTLPERFGKEEARRRLGVPPAEYLVCSFGGTGPTKLNHRLFQVWPEFISESARPGRLVCVGGRDDGEYGRKLARLARSAGKAAPIRAVGFVDRETYGLWRDAADVAVQFRAHTRGETSAAALDCLAAGLPLIFNAHGAMADFPEGVGFRLPDDFTDGELKEALARIADDAALAARLSEQGREYVKTHCAPERVGRLYWDALESHFHRAARQRESVLLRELALREGESAPDSGQLACMSRALVQARPVAQAQLLVDVSAIARNDLKTGIERVVRAQIKSLFHCAPEGHRLEPVYLSADGGRWHYCYARAYTRDLLGIAGPGLPDEPVAVHPGDILYIPDRFANGLIQATAEGLYQNWRALGVRIHVLIHDLLPITMPQCFPAGAPEDHARYLTAAVTCADALGSISGTTQRGLQAWLQDNPPKRPDSLAFWNVPHGADQWEKPEGMAADSHVREVLRKASRCPTFLAVGTVEPRKGYLQVLDAFDRLWEMGENINLVIVGKEGWGQLAPSERRTIPEIVRRLRQHHERRLFWLEGISDGDLAQLYAASTSLLAASWGEGFGLPLIEAAQAGLPVVARDISVFREVAGRGAWYFHAETGEKLADAIRDWLALYAKGRHPDPADIQWLTWDENACRLSGFLVGRGFG